MPRHPTSSLAACVWIPLFPLRCEEARRPELGTCPTALLSPDASRKLWQVSHLARHAGVQPGMTVSRAIGLCPTLRLCEPDPVHYDERFTHLLAALNEVSPVIEPVELGLVYLGCDGLEGIYGSPAQIVAAIECGVRGAECGVDSGSPLADSAPRTPHPARVGWGLGKFTAWVAATRAKPGDAVIVSPGEAGRFLAAQPIAVLPLDPDTHRRLRQLGIRTLGALAALPEEAVAAQFGGAGRRLWRLAAGRIAEPVVGRLTPEPIVAALTFFRPVGERDLLERSLDQLIARALKHPRRIGWRVQAVRLRAEMEGGGDWGGSRGAACCAPTDRPLRSWLVEATLKDPTADAARVAAPLKSRLEQAPPAGAVERLIVEFTAFAPGTAELQLFARDAGAAARAGRRRALQSAAHEIQLRLKRSYLYHVIEVQPWSRLPERRYALIDFEP